MDPKTLEALKFYNSHTAQIEVVRPDRTLEQVKIFKGIININYFIKY